MSVSETLMSFEPCPGCPDPEGARQAAQKSIDNVVYSPALMGIIMAFSGEGKQVVFYEPGCESPRKAWHHVISGSVYCPMIRNNAHLDQYPVPDTSLPPEIDLDYYAAPDTDIPPVEDC